MKRFKKKGSLQDLIFIGVALLTIAIVTLVMFKISDELNTKFQDENIITSAKARQAYGRINNLYPGAIDNSFLFLTIGLCLVALFLAAMVRIHPIFFVFYLVLLVVIIFISGVFSNIYLEMANQADLLDIAQRLTFITHIMYILPFLVGVFGFLLALIMYKNWREAAV